MVSERGAAVSLGIVYGIDVYEYGWGQRRDIGLDSPEFAAAITVDTTITLGPPALGAAVGTIIEPGLGTVVGTGVGYAVSFLWGIFGREPAIQLTSEYIYRPIWEGENAIPLSYPSPGGFP